MLKYTIDSENFTALNEVEQSFYAQSGEGYQLQVEGATAKSKLDEFRSSNVEHMKQAELYKGVDVVKYRAMEEQERKIRDKELIDKKDFDGLISERTNSIVSDFEARILNLTNERDNSENNYNKLVSKHEIEGAAVKAFTEHNIIPEAFEAILSQIKGKFSIDNGRVVARDGDNILTGLDGNLTVSEYVAGQPEIFKIQSSGGAATGAATSPSRIDTSTAKRAAYAKLLGH